MHARCRNADAQLAALAVSDEVLVPIATYRLDGDAPVTLRGITGFVGGTASDLDSVATLALTPDTGIPYFIRVDGQTIPVYFESGAADDTEPGEIAPLDALTTAHWTRGS